MEWDARLKVIKSMKAYGGSFVKALANAWQFADADNSAKIEAAFAEYIETYSKRPVPDDEQAA